MSNQQNSSTQVDDDVRESHQPSKQRSRNFYRKRPGNERQNQDLGEDENRVSNEDDTQRLNNSDENTRGARVGRGGFQRGRGRGRFARGPPFLGNFHPAYSPYTNYAGFYYPEDGYYGPLYHGGDLSEQEAYNNYPIRGNRSFRGGRGRGGRRGPITKNENTDNNDQQQSEDTKINKRRQRKQRQTNDNGSGTEQRTDGAVTDDQQQDENKKDSARQQRRKSDRRRRRNTNASQSGGETEERAQSGKPKDDETIVKNVVRSIVNKVVHRLAPRNRRKSQLNTKDASENKTDVERSQPRNVRRGGRGQSGNGYLIDQGYYDPYGMAAYYYGMYYGYGGQGYGGRGRARGGRGRGRFRQRGGANKENQPQDNNEEGKIGESNPIGNKLQSKTAISEKVNQLSTNDESRQ